MQSSNDFYNQILSHGPSQETYLLILGQMKREGRWRDVMQQCLKALNIFPHDIRIRHLLAQSYLEVGFMGKAQEELEKILSELGDIASVYKLQAKLFLRQQRSREAYETLNRYMVINPHDQEAVPLLEQIRSIIGKETPTEGRPSTEEIRAEEEGEEKSPPPELATPTLAEIYYRQGQLSEAVSTYEKVLNEHPEDRASMERLAELRAITVDHPVVPLKPKPDIRARREKMITVLEGWLAKIQESSIVG